PPASCTGASGSSGTTSSPRSLCMCALPSCSLRTPPRCRSPTTTLPAWSGRWSCPASAAPGRSNRSAPTSRPAGSPNAPRCAVPSPDSAPVRRHPGPVRTRQGPAPDVGAGPDPLLIPPAQVEQDSQDPAVVLVGAGQAELGEDRTDVG